MDDLKVKSVDGVETPDAGALTQPETPVMEKKSTPRNEAGDIVINLDALPKADEEVVEEPATSDSDEVVEEPKVEEEIRSSGLGEVHNPEEDETSKPTLERVEDGDESPTPAPKQEEVPAVTEAPQLPENVEKLIAFLDETGGSIEDYANLNRDISKLDDIDVIKEYYRQKNPRMSEDRLTRKMDKAFLFDEDIDETSTIQDKKDLFEDELYEARNYLEGRKDKYYADLKSSAAKNLPAEAQEALAYYSDQKQASESNQKLNDVFLDRTDKLFNEDFKGFDFKVGDSKFRVNVGDAKKVKADQVDINKFISRFVGEDGSITDPAGYHKAMYAANNVDALATHFYEQGRADAITQSAKSSKNIDMGGRSDMGNAPSTHQGMKVRALTSESDYGFKIKTRK